MISANEIALVKACQQKDPHAQSKFYELYKKKLMGICLRYAHTTAEADEIFQDAFVKVFDQINTLKNPEQVAHWTKTIVVRTAIDYYRLQRRRGIWVEYEQVLENIQEQVNMEDFSTQEEVLKIINSLPAGYRMVANMFFIDGYTHQEIAQLLQISEGTSKSQLARARDILKRKLKAMGLWALTF